MNIQKFPARVPAWLTAVPVSGPALWPLELDFSSDSVIDVDFSQLQRNGSMDFIQTLWIDNQPNSAILTVAVPDLPFHMNINGGVQIWTPVPCKQECKLRFTTTSAANLVIPVIASNVSLPYIQVF
jgi:hypothetical protein